MIYFLIKASLRENLSESKDHKKIIEKGKPDDVPQGFKYRKEPLPPTPISGVVNKYGAKVRLTFKTEADQLWIATKGIIQCRDMQGCQNLKTYAQDGKQQEQN